MYIPSQPMIGPESLEILVQNVKDAFLACSSFRYDADTT